METVTGMVALAVLVLVLERYQTFLKRSLQPRVFLTTLDPERIRSLFTEHVCTTGWKLLSAADANPLVAQAPRWAGLRGALMPQEISLQLETIGAQTHGALAAGRYTTNLFGVPVRAHTLRYRLDKFTAALSSLDSEALLRVGGEAAA